MTEEILLSVVIPAYNEEDAVGPFLNELLNHAQSWTFAYEVIVVDDGSTDSTWDVLQSFQQRQFKCIRLATNFGHQIALEVGYRDSRGKFVVSMDADGQHPVSAIDRMLQEVRDHSLDVVYGVPFDRKSNSIGKRSSGRAYYWLMRQASDVPITTNAADFRLVSRRVVDIINSVTSDKVHRLLIPSLHLPSGTIQYNLGVRTFGQTKYSTAKMVRLAAESVVQYSTRPLRFLMILGLAIFLLAIGWIVWIVVEFLSGGTVRGWASQMSVTLALGGIIMLSIGFVGRYLALVLDIVRGTPRFVIRDRTGERPLD